MTKGLFDRLEAELVAREKTPGLSMTDMLAMPEDRRRLFRWMLRKRTPTLAEIAAFSSSSEASTAAMLQTLVDKGWVRELELHGERCYQVRLARKRARDLPDNLWQALASKTEE